MTTHQHSDKQIIARTTQDGYDWPTAHPEAPKPMAPYFRAQLIEDSYIEHSDVPIWQEEMQR